MNVKLISEHPSLLHEPTGYKHTVVSSYPDTIPLDRVYFQGDLNARGDINFTESTVDDTFTEGISIRGILQPIHVVALYDEDAEGGYEPRFMALDGMRRAIAISNLIERGETIAGSLAIEYKLPCVVRGDVNPYDEADRDSEQLNLNNHRTYTASAISRVVNKYLSMNYQPSKVASLLKVSKQLVNYYSSIGKDPFVLSLIEDGTLSVNSGKKLISCSKSLHSSTSDFYTGYLEYVSKEGLTKTTASSIHEYYTTVAPEFNTSSNKPLELEPKERDIDKEVMPSSPSSSTPSGPSNTPVLPIGSMLNPDRTQEPEEVSVSSYSELIECIDSGKNYTGDSVKRVVSKLVSGMLMGSPPKDLCSFLVPMLETETV